MELLQAFLLVGLAVGAVLFLFISQSRKFGKQLDQLNPKSKKPKIKDGLFTREEVAQHNKPDDAWVIIQHKETGEMRVYDLTEYRFEHPGGDALLRNAGGEATEGFHGPHHPVTTFLIAEEFQIGKLKDS